jgi:hypothetical protein
MGFSKSGVAIDGGRNVLYLPDHFQISKKVIHSTFLSTDEAKQSKTVIHKYQIPRSNDCIVFLVVEISTERKIRMLNKFVVHGVLKLGDGRSSRSATVDI